MGDVGDEIAADVLQVHQLGHVACHQQPEPVGIRYQAQAEADARVDRGGRVQQRLGVAPAGQPVRNRQRPQAVAQCGLVVFRVVQPQQVAGGLVEPLDPLGVALQHHHCVGQGGGGGAIGAQHLDQALRAVAGFLLAAVQKLAQVGPGIVAAVQGDALA